MSEDCIYLAPLAGRGRIALAMRVRRLSASPPLAAFAEAAPHPNPLPAKGGEREEIEPSSSLKPEFVCLLSIIQRAVAEHRLAEAAGENAAVGRRHHEGQRFRADLDLGEHRADAAMREFAELADFSHGLHDPR
jgi:hypothetical protein